MKNFLRCSKTSKIQWVQLSLTCKPSKMCSRSAKNSNISSFWCRAALIFCTLNLSCSSSGAKKWRWALKLWIRKILKKRLFSSTRDSRRANYAKITRFVYLLLKSIVTMNQIWKYRNKSQENWFQALPLGQNQSKSQTVAVNLVSLKKSKQNQSKILKNSQFGFNW